jgi:alpha-L-fucosidase 2
MVRRDLCGLSLAALLVVGFAAVPAGGQSRQETSAWKNGHYQIERKGVVERSDIVLQRPNLKPSEAMPLGNGRLGVAVWAEDGLTVQLNRADTWPVRLSPGQVVLEGLKKLTSAADYEGRLNLYNGEFVESGGGMQATAYVDDAQDALVIDVKGADPEAVQTARLRLWAPRKPKVIVHEATGALAETWLDNKEAGASNETFGSLAAVTADAREIHAHADDAVSITISFKPHPDGTFRVLVASPAWRGGDAPAESTRLLASAKSIRADGHRAWWNGFWDHVGLMKLFSPDHAAEYFENLRMIDLFAAAAESRDRLPGGQAGVGDLFSPLRDEHQWGPSAYWHWNLRMQVSANLGAGAAELNAPYFRLYRENLDNILAWTKKHMGGRPGACVPETMRFNGAGYENEAWLNGPVPVNCGEDWHPYYNARTISTGLEVSLWIWAQYEYTGDLEFLKKNYPLMRESARFLLAYGKRDAQGVLHTFPSNAHENNWDVHDPTTDIAAMRAVFPQIVKAAKLLQTDAGLVRELEAQITKLPELPLATIASPTALTQEGADSADTIIASSYDPAAEVHNSENIGLEPVWPYGLVGDDGPLHALGVRTFAHRPNKNVNDWSYDPVQAARLGLADELKASLRSLTEQHQTYPNGFASFAGGKEFYVEQVGIVADTLQKALAVDYDGIVRIAPAWPRDWDADGTVSLLHGNKADVQMRNGKPVSVGLEIATAGTVTLRNPWPGEAVEVVDARNGSVVLPAHSNAVLAFPVQAAKDYLVRRVAEAKANQRFDAVSGTRATAPKSLGASRIGLEK